MEKKLTRTQQLALSEVWDYRAGGYPIFWKMASCQVLAERGLIERRPTHRWDQGYGWFVTDAGKAALPPPPEPT